MNCSSINPMNPPSRVIRAVVERLGDQDLLGKTPLAISVAARSSATRPCVAKVTSVQAGADPQR